MTDEVARHYQELLAEHYSWMLGMPFQAKLAEQRALLEALGLAEARRGAAIDLGCGPGFQAIALAGLGFAPVLALDTSQALLDELAAQKGDLPVEAVRADLRGFAGLVKPGSVAAITCMGDTLTHLPARQDVSRLFADAQTALAPGGLLVLTFRDLSVALKGLDRFIPVRADAERIMTCVLDYEPETVMVSDLVYRREGEGWRLSKSCYRKLRLAPQAVADELSRLGLTVLRHEPAGRLHAIVARR